MPENEIPRWNAHGEEAESIAYQTMRTEGLSHEEAEMRIADMRKMPQPRDLTEDERAQAVRDLEEFTAKVKYRAGIKDLPEQTSS